MSKPYWEKLQDPRWFRFRDQFLRDKSVETDYGLKPQCENCGHWPDKYVQVHHKRYINGREPWEYDYEDLRILCRECHEYIHTLEKRLRAFAISLTVDECDQMAALLDEMELCKKQDNLAQALGYAKHEVRDLYFQFEYQKAHPGEFGGPIDIERAILKIMGKTSR